MKLFAESINEKINVVASTRDFYVDDFSVEEITTTGFLADIRQATDYSPFGVTLEDRNLTLAGAEKSRYGFNGMEKDDEAKGQGNSYDFGARMHDPRLGRFLSLDAYAGKFASATPYSFAGNSPILFIDLNGDFKIPYHLSITETALLNVRHSISGTAQLDLIYGVTIGADIDGAFSDYHFDGRKDFKEISNNWKRLYGIASRLRKDIGPFNLKWGGNDIQELGTLLHNVQDFYAHSNYVELYIEYYQDTHDGEVPAISEIPTYFKGLKDKEFKNKYLKKNLKTGEFHTGRYLTGKDVEKTHEEGDTHHDDIAKDNPSMGVTYIGTDGETINSFDAAKELATKHTEGMITTVVVGRR